jgi:transcriptional regulator with XRE-family HTH domain
MSRASIANIEAGKQGVQIQMVFELAEQLQISPSDLIPVFNDSGNLRDLSEVQTLQLIRRQLAASQ